jgi:hypothetical protein
MIFPNLSYVVSLKYRHSPQEITYFQFQLMLSQLVECCWTIREVYLCSTGDAFWDVEHCDIVPRMNTVSTGSRPVSEGIWCCSHTNHYKLTHTVSRCIPTHISLIPHAPLSLMQIPDDTVRADADGVDTRMLRIQSVISIPIRSSRYFGKKICCQN